MQAYPLKQLDTLLMMLIIIKVRKIKACSKVSFCSDEQCQFHKQGVQEVKCK